MRVSLDSLPPQEYSQWMKLRLDLLEHLTDEDILEEVLANNHRYKPQPNFSKTGVGSLIRISTGASALRKGRSWMSCDTGLRCH
jgi:hypothetical protein